MKLITDLKQNCLEPASVALGCFDGIHLGHQAVIGCAVADKPNGLTPSVFTFQENPLQVLTGNTVTSIPYFSPNCLSSSEPAFPPFPK